MLRPKSLKKGDTIGVFAPSSRADRAKVDLSADFLRQAGYNVYIHPQTYAAHNQSAGTTQEKLDAFHDLLRNPDIKAIFAAAGGNRSGYMLPDIDYDLVRDNPKILVGFSDVTALLVGLNTTTGLVTFHGPDMGRLYRMPPDQQTQLLDLLSGKTDFTFDGADTITAGTITGKLVGGNLSLLTSLTGTPWQPDYKDSIVFVEDCNDQTSRYDRMLLQLSNAGAFGDAGGIIAGEFTTGTDSGNSFGFGLKEIFQYHAVENDLTVVTMDVPFGHGDNLFTIPIGAEATVEADMNGKVKMTLSRPATSGP